MKNNKKEYKNAKGGKHKMIKISKFRDEYTNDVIDLVLHFQNDGTRPPVSVNDQPDLLYITEKYINAGGYFGIATDNGKLGTGTIGVMM